MRSKTAQHVVFDGYCPRHEFASWECCRCCDALIAAMWRLDEQLLAYWVRHGYTKQKRAAA